jgi:hypothetical protein
LILNEAEGPTSIGSSLFATAKIRSTNLVATAFKMVRLCRPPSSLRLETDHGLNKKRYYFYSTFQTLPFSAKLQKTAFSKKETLLGCISKTKKIFFSTFFRRSK